MDGSFHCANEYDPFPQQPQQKNRRIVRSLHGLSMRIDRFGNVAARRRVAVARYSHKSHGRCWDSEPVDSIVWGGEDPARRRGKDREKKKETYFVHSHQLILVAATRLQKLCDLVSLDDY